MELNSAVTDVLDMLLEPAMLIKSGTVRYINSFAKALFPTGETGMPAELFFGGEAGLFPLLSKQGGVVAGVRLGGETYDVSARVTQDALVVIFHRDISKQRLEPSAMSGISGVIRTPLSALMALSSTMFPELEQMGSERLTAQLSMLNRNFYILFRLSNNMSDMAKILSGNWRLNSEKCDAVEFIDQCVEFVRPLCEQQEIAVRWQPPKGQIMADIDKEKLERAVFNLTSNAMRACDRGGEICFSLSEKGGNVLISVGDNGCGFDQQTLANLFCRVGINQSDDFSKRAGLGLGLPIVRAVALLHGGRLVIEPGPNCGATAAISIPKRQPEGDSLTLKTKRINYDYAGEIPHVLVELADVLPSERFDPKGV